MNKKLVGFAFVLILVGVLGVSLVSASWLGDFFGKITGEVAAGDEGLGVASIDDEGLWIDARQAGSYYAIHNSLIRDASGNIHMTYGSSSEPFDSMYAPDWRETAIYATDSVGYQFSSDNGSTWSDAKKVVNAVTEDHFWTYSLDWKIERAWGEDGYAWEYSEDYEAWIGFQKSEDSNLGTGWGVIMREQENLWQGPCSNVLVYFQGKYYLYFESYTSPTGILSIYVARANQPGGPYEIWTWDGWQANPTASSWRPVIRPNIVSVAGEFYVADNYKKQGDGNPYSLLYGAGLPRGVTQKDGKIYLYYIDTSYWFVWKDEQGQVHEYGRGADDQIPYQLVAIGTDPTNLENNYDNRMVDESGVELWDYFSPKYFPEQNKFYNFMLKEVEGKNEIMYRSSDDGVVWSDETVLGDAPVTGKIEANGPYHWNDVVEVYPNLVPLANRKGEGNLNDLYLTYAKEYLFQNPIGWKDTPDFKWYYGGTDIYALKINFNLDVGDEQLQDLGDDSGDDESGVEVGDGGDDADEQVQQQEDVGDDSGDEEMIEIPEDWTDEEALNFCGGCLTERICYSAGYRKLGDYCTETKEWVSQKDTESSCENNFECKSNVCVENTCISLNLWQRFLNWFQKLFS